MPHCLRLIFACLLLTAAATIVRAQALSFGSRAPAQPVKARAVISLDPLTPGLDAAIAVEVTVDSRYHIQSAYPDKDYIATELTPAAAPGITFGRAKYPVAKDVPPPAGLPDAKPIPVYEGTVYILLPLHVDASTAPTRQTIALALTVQACDATSCLPPSTLNLTVPITIAAAGTAQSQPDATLIAAAEKQAYATPATAPTQPTSSPGTVVPGPTPANFSTTPGRLIKLLSTEDQLAAISARPYKPFNAAEHDYPLALIALLALVGGLILNIMPCVLPVVPLKVLSLVQQAHGDRRLAVLHGLAFSAGTVSLFVALALFLKTFGLFYGQQYQSPGFLIAMALLVVALALSMLGVWTINPPGVLYNLDASGHSGYLGAYGNGLMATLLATPCSAPYLGPVFAWAFIQPAWLTAAALALVGVGMSAPYLLLAAFPKLLDRLPRTGRWTELLKQALGIIMIGVAIYLITLVPNVTWWPWILLAAVLVGLTCWGWGQIPTPTMAPARLWTIRIIVLLLGALLGAGIYTLASRTESAAIADQPGDTIVLPDQTNGQWIPFNVALLDAALADHRPVVIDWTANWCINCRALEAAVLSRQSVQQAFIDHRAVLLRADLSANNPPADALNQKLGSQSIPVLAIFAPSRPNDPIVLRDSYTTTRVITELDNAR